MPKKERKSKSAEGEPVKTVRVTRRRKDSARGKGNLFTKIAIIVFGAFVTVSVFNMQTKISDMKEEQVQLEEEIRKYTNSIEELQADLATPYDDDYIIKIARQKLGYCFPEEMMFYNDISN